MSNNLSIIEPVIHTERAGSTESVIITDYSLCDTKLYTIEHTGQSHVFFCGYSDNRNVIDYFDGSRIRKAFELMKTAVNNRTIERDYFRRYCEMLMGELSEEEFERELDEHEDHYIVSNDQDLDKDDLRLALYLSDGIKDVSTSEDLASLFSFDVLKTEKLLEE